jgi:HSP20 family protein
MNALTRFDRLDDWLTDFRRFMQPWPRLGEPMGEIRVDIDESDKAYTVSAELPGVKKEDLRVEIDGNLVSISGEVKKDVEEKDKGGRTLVRETYRGSVSRSFSLAHDIDRELVTAKLEDGVLKLTLPKREGKAGRRIAIQ